MRANQFSVLSKLATLGAVAALAAMSVATGQEFAAVSGSAPKVAHAGKKFVAKVSLDVPSGYHVYSPTFKGVGVPMSFKLEKGPAGAKLLTPTGYKGGELTGDVKISVPVWVPKNAKGHQSFTIGVRFQQCNDRVCLPPTTKHVSFKTTVR